MRSPGGWRPRALSQLALPTLRSSWERTGASCGGVVEFLGAFGCQSFCVACFQGQVVDGRQAGAASVAAPSILPVVQPGTGGCSTHVAPLHVL